MAGLAGMILLLPSAAAAECWCDPRAPGILSQCWDNWTVTEQATGFRNVVCEGAPPGTGGLIAGFVAPHACPHLALALSGQSGLWFPAPHLPPIVSTFAVQPFAAFPCIALDPGLPLIPRWPGVHPAKESIARSAAAAQRLLIELQQRLATAPAFGPQWRGLKALISNVAGNLASMIMVLKDPPNPDYGHLPPAYALPPVAPLVAGGDLTPAQAAAINAWVPTSRALMALIEQANQTMDNVSGAVEAGPSSPTARVWAARLARFMDRLHDQIAVAILTESAARGAIVAAYPSVAVPAACITPAQLGAAAPDLFAIGAAVLSVQEYQTYALAHPCTTAGTWPGVLTEGAADRAAVAAAFGALTYADTVCAATGYCSVGTDTIGVWRPSTNTFYLRNSNTAGPAELTIAGIGAPGDRPLIGDWDGNGTMTIGLFRPSTKTFYLWNSNTYGVPDIQIAGIGATGDVPLVGDWDGNGTTTFGLWRPSSNTFYLWNTNGYGAPDVQITAVGATGDTPVVGDWDGTGFTKIGLYRPSTNTYYLWATNAYGAPAYSVAGLGAAGDLPVVGDWDGNGTATLGLYRPSTHTFYLWNQNAYGAPHIVVPNYGAVGDVPVAGNWDGA